MLLSVPTGFWRRIPMKIRVKRHDDGAVVPYKTHDWDFCYDVVATSCEELAPNVYRYGIGLSFEIVRDYRFDDEYRLSIDFRPRSSVWKTGMVLSNCEGTVDEIYRGQVFAVFYHVFPDMPKYEVGDRIGQIKVGVTLAVDFEEVTELSYTDRGAGGYGSTGR